MLIGIQSNWGSIDGMIAWRGVTRRGVRPCGIGWGGLIVGLSRLGFPYPTADRWQWMGPKPITMIIRVQCLLQILGTEFERDLDGHGRSHV